MSVGIHQGNRTYIEKNDLRVGFGPPTGNMLSRMPNDRNSSAVQAMGTEKRSPM